MMPNSKGECCTHSLISEDDYLSIIYFVFITEEKVIKCTLIISRVPPLHLMLEVFTLQ